MPNGIIVFGANGSGKSTIARELAEVLNYKYMDIEEYHFIESEIPYTKARTREECLNLMLEDINTHKNFVLSAVTGDFDDYIESMYSFAVLLVAPLEIRIDRVKRRAFVRHGERISEGGDMYKQHLEFVEFVRTRTSDRIAQWNEKLKCPVITIDSTKPISENIELIVQEYFHL
ncbi:shikimate kinase [Natranaerovirga pectinivora]|uniref:Shikimate kinase n=1 Tax=Natranaerovirga pectinivora TaxID=682400 RepID=A0A4R3MDT7_9FIRM|nr:AAA family ATPase [Natranaerovirga pectinivora]TCT11616.1 shikimate kinase [Natranaerovirga pectinivora]